MAQGSGGVLELFLVRSPKLVWIGVAVVALALWLFFLTGSTSTLGGFNHDCGTVVSRETSPDRAIQKDCDHKVDLNRNAAIAVGIVGVVLIGVGTQPKRTGLRPPKPPSRQADMG